MDPDHQARLKPGKEAEFAAIGEQLRAIEQPGSGLLRSTSARDQDDPRAVYLIVTFESEAAARAREADPRRQEGLGPIHAKMADIFEGAPEFTNLEVVSDHTPET
ncbi:MAG TPA: antibiotic biosynthesis monooxygenase [Mycobacteriales bacterium]|nr:antibiotic biosynthesis monooxygenase [Mycobacteriales bacterium]